ncbi:MAG TPA: hypothetical protein VFO16_06690, partial [Pseudonocardiaceae bacterium]|nr:hypothetical protein [Pseudonocardiaceae bacterium]
MGDGGGGGGGVADGSGGSDGPYAGCGGGGGTSLVPEAGTLANGVNSGDGQVTISYQSTSALTSTSLGVIPASPAAAGTTETLTATITPAGATGSVVFTDSSTILGAA